LETYHFKVSNIPTLKPKKIFKKILMFLIKQNFKKKNKFRITKLTIWWLQSFNTKTYKKIYI